jgi:uncharacterized spore protein YtfJ
MEIVENITRTTLQEIEKILNTRTIVGEPLVIDGRSIIPIISIAFGFGAGGGSGRGEGQRKGEGEGGGTGGGAWIRPVAVVVSDKDSIRVEPVIGGISGAIEKMGESFPKLMETLIEKWAQRKKEE